MPQLYRYVGPKKIADRSATSPMGVRVASAEDVRRWVRNTGQLLNHSKDVTVTFVIDEDGLMRIADRRSEHVACAGGKPVLSAGEITFSVLPREVLVSWITNQSTGYCPKPDSWTAVLNALQFAGIDAPDGFSQEFLFRRCPHCGTINIVKNEVFECAVCSTELPAEWNLGSVPINA